MTQPALYEPEINTEYDPDQLLSPAAVAALFEVDESTVGKWWKRGELPVVLIGPHQKPRFLRSDIREYIERRRTLVRR